MTTFSGHIGLGQPVRYLIKVQGRLDTDLSDWFSGESRSTVETGWENEPVTCMTGTVVDQAALHGLLQRIRDLGLVLLYVDCLSAHEAQQNLEEI